MESSSKFGLAIIGIIMSSGIDNVAVYSSDNQVAQQLRVIIERSYPIKKIEVFTTNVIFHFSKRQGGWNDPAYYAPEAAFKLIPILLEMAWEPLQVTKDGVMQTFYFKKQY